ncbi:hypothetical protein DYB38_000828 [Aphanomyces astaci]|uniref:PDZ domain-containing protein n=2 Tax=Aphanomyces astaci TaxID=112090 RepID=A0A397CAN8_APHAT|nr:hypothetical protein DYB38_000828 [Aphanomyces astaci]
MEPIAPEYTVRWHAGHLGVWLQEDPASGAAVISKLVRPLPPHFTQLDTSEGSVGDVLVAVGTTGPITYDDAVELLQHPTLPLDLVFRNRRNDLPLYAAPSSVRRYSFEWTADMKPLGMSFAKDPISLVTVISNLNKDVLPPAVKSCRPRVGDVVLSIGPATVTDMKFHDVLALLGRVEKPIMLAFDQVQTTSSSVGDGKYDIEYRGEGLGIVFERKEDRPVIQSTSGTHPNAATGDELIAIDGVDTKSLGFQDAMAKLQHVQGLMRLSFRKVRPHEVIDGMYDVHYLGGRLGLVLAEGQTKSSHPVIDEITDASTAAGLELASKRDALLSVDGVDTASLGFAKTVAMIKQVDNAVVLRFKKGPSSGQRTEATTSGFLRTMVEALFI